MNERINLVEELRLRRWAREHYVAENLRRMDWHPVIIEEMLIKDQEMGRQNPTTNLRFVPLLSNLNFRLDSAHETFQQSTSKSDNFTEMFVG